VLIVKDSGIVCVVILPIGTMSLVRSFVILAVASQKRLYATKVAKKTTTATASKTSAAKPKKVKAVTAAVVPKKPVCWFY